jgi:hypothetical protein
VTHELHAVVPAGSSTNPEAFANAVVRSGSWAATPGDALRYAAPDTGVTATLVSADPPDSLGPGYVHLGVALEISYVRPTFLARESIGAFAAIVRGMDALIFDPQASDRPEEPDDDALVVSWRDGNRRAVRVAREMNPALPWTELSVADAWWQYQRALPHLRRAFMATHYVPVLRFVRRADDARVLRTMSWPDLVPVILPECELIILMRSDPVHRFVIDGVASAPDVEDRLSGIVESIDIDHPESRRLSVVPGSGADVVNERLSSIALEPFEAFVSVDADGFVDEPPAS